MELKKVNPIGVKKQNPKIQRQKKVSFNGSRIYLVNQDQKKKKIKNK